MSPQPAAPDRDVTVPRPGAAHRVHLAASGVSVLLDEEDVNRAVRAIHEKFFDEP